MKYYIAIPQIIKVFEAETLNEAERLFKQDFYNSGEPRGFLMNENGDVLLDFEHQINVTISGDENNGE